MHTRIQTNKMDFMLFLDYAPLFRLVLEFSISEIWREYLYETEVFPTTFPCFPLYPRIREERCLPRNALASALLQCAFQKRAAGWIALDSRGHVQREGGPVCVFGERERERKGEGVKGKETLEKEE